MDDTRIALLSQGLKKVKNPSVLLADTHIGKSVVVFNSYNAVAIDANDIDSSYGELDPKELKKAIQLKLSLSDAVEGAMKQADIDPPEYLNTTPAVVEGWTPELTELSRIFGRIKQSTDRPTVDQIHRVESGHLTVTNGFIMAQAPTSLPEDFSLPGRLVRIIAGLLSKVDPMLIHYGRFDNADLIRVDMLSGCGHIVSAWGYTDNTSKFPPTSQVEAFFDKEDRALRFHEGFDAPTNLKPAADLHVEFSYENDTAVVVTKSGERHVLWSAEGTGYETTNPQEFEKGGDYPTQTLLDTVKLTYENYVHVAKHMTIDHLHVHMHHGVPVVIFGRARKNKDVPIRVAIAGLRT